MRTKTKILVGTSIASGLVASAGAFVMANPTNLIINQALTHSAFYVVAFGSIALVGAVAAMIGLGIQGKVKRDTARKRTVKNIKTLAMVKDRSKTYKYSKTLTNAIYYLTKNNQNIITGVRSTEKNSVEIRKHESLTYRAMSGDNHAQKVLRKTNENMRLQSLGANSNTQENSSVKYGVMVIPQNGGMTHSFEEHADGTGFRDHRNEIVCFSEKTRNEYFRIAEQGDAYSEDLKTSSGVSYYEDGGFTTSVKFSKDTLPEIYVKSTAERNMDEFELRLLEDARDKIVAENRQETAFPIVITKNHYKDNEKCIESMPKTVNSIDDLNERIDCINRAIHGSKSVCVTNTHYVYAEYKRTTVVDPSYDKPPENSEAVESEIFTYTTSQQDNEYSR